MGKADVSIQNLSRKKYFYPIVLTIVVLIVYFPVLFNNFLYQWDDQWVAINQYTEGGMNWENIWAILTEYYNGQYGPLNEYLFLINYNLFGYNTFTFHLVNLLMHTASASILYFVILKIFMLTSRIQTKHPKEIAFLTSLLFAIHPINVEAVAWISAVKIISYAFFYLLATYTFLIYIERKQFRFYLYTVLLFILSFGGKEQAVTFPVWILMLYWTLGYSFRDLKIWTKLIPLFLLAIFFGFVTMWSQADVGAGILAGETSFPMWQRIIFACYALMEYLVKVIFPYNLLYIYPFPIVLGESVPTWMLLYPSLLIIIVVTLWKFISKWPVACGLLFFLIHIGVTLHIIPLSRFAIVADRYVYISSIGVVFIVAYYFILFYERGKSMSRTILSAILVCIILSLGIYSNLRCHEWKDTQSIKRDLRELLKQREDYKMGDKEFSFENSPK